MAAELVDLDKELEDIGETVDLDEKPQSDTTPKEEPPKEEKPELPSKYKGKALEDVIQMAEEADKLMNRHAQEVGEARREAAEVRKLADELLKSQLTRKAEVEKPQEIDFFENPQEAMKRAVESNPILAGLQADRLQYKQELNRQKLLSKHPDLMNVVQDSEFIDWIKASPVRVKLFNEAHQNYDFDSGDELLSTYKQISGFKKVSRETPVSEVEKESRKQAVKSASVDSGGTNESSRKVYRRADLMRLMQRDPARYEAMSDEILEAYRSGRVR